MLNQFYTAIYLCIYLGRSNVFVTGIVFGMTGFKSLNSDGTDGLISVLLASGYCTLSMEIGCTTVTPFDLSKVP